MASPKFQIFEGKNGEYYFRFVAGNGQTMLRSEGYKAKASAQNGINSVQTNVPDDDRFDRRTSKDGQHYFALEARNGEIIAMSERYSTASNRERAIKRLKQIVPGASVEDTTDTQ